MLLIEILIVIHNLTDHQSTTSLTTSNILQFIKTTLLLFIISLIIYVIGMLPGFGYSVLLLGVILLIVSLIDPLLKILCPYLAANFSKISMVLSQLETIERAFMTLTSSLIKQIDSKNNGKRKTLKNQTL